MRSKVWSNMCRFRMIVDLIQNSTDSSTTINVSEVFICKINCKGNDVSIIALKCSEIKVLWSIQTSYGWEM
ncbi:unnamed protein product [Moneuplotes crassus]|uniref:Uncharacterized protein n=1 Tax=Euplotes crassus TaxID=5936 RepID=A0AAD1XZ92_EUPCR|nr:unnamed protein product [Moneuplotes crassus]